MRIRAVSLAGCSFRRAHPRARTMPVLLLSFGRPIHRRHRGNSLLYVGDTFFFPFTRLVFLLPLTIQYHVPSFLFILYSSIRTGSRCPKRIPVICRPKLRHACKCNMSHLINVSKFTVTSYMDSAKVSKQVY